MSSYCLRNTHVRVSPEEEGVVGYITSEQILSMYQHGILQKSLRYVLKIAPGTNDLEVSIKSIVLRCTMLVR